MSVLQRWVLALIACRVAGMPDRTHAWANVPVVTEYTEWFQNVAYNHCPCDHGDACAINVTSALSN